MQRNKAALFWPVLLIVTAIDFYTKRLAMNGLPLAHVPNEVFGDWLRFTRVFNPGAAFGLHVGQHSRWIFTGLTIIALLILARLYRSTRHVDRLRTLSLGLVCGGAIGNLLDRLASANGVIDFIDIGFGDSRWPTFNIADVAVSTGAFLLAWVLWEEDRETAPVAAPVTAVAPVPSESGEIS